MKIPIDWLKEYVRLPEDLDLLTDKLTLAGHMLDKVETVNSQKVIDLELRGNRADCYSLLGIAQEVKAIFGHQVKYPPLHPKLKKVSQLKECRIKIKSRYVKRAVAVVVKNVKIIRSPAWLRTKLKTTFADCVLRITR